MQKKCFIIIIILFRNFLLCLIGCWRPEYEGGSRGSRKPAGRYGDHACDAPWELIESAVRTMMSRQGDNIEFVLWTG